MITEFASHIAFADRAMFVSTVPVLAVAMLLLVIGLVIGGLARATGCTVGQAAQAVATIVRSFRAAKTRG